MKFASNGKAKCIKKNLEKETNQNNGESMCPIKQPRKKELKAQNSSPIIASLSWASKAWKNGKEGKGKKKGKGIRKHDARMWVGRSKEKVGRLKGR